MLNKLKDSTILLKYFICAKKKKSRLVLVGNIDTYTYRTIYVKQNTGEFTFTAIVT